MVKVFLVEDESTLREMLRDSVPWEQYGFSFAGEAGDGEMALPLLRQTAPDILITDIRMPFMDGLALSRQVRREFPDTKIVILSGYDDFEYARQAVDIGVEKYLLKPVTKTALLTTLQELKEKIAYEREQQNYVEKFRQETREYEQYTRRRFVEKIMSGHLSVREIYEEAQRMDIDLAAESYAVMLFSLPVEETGKAGDGETTELRESILAFFLKYPAYQILRWNLNTYMVLVKSTADTIEACCEKGVAFLRSQLAPGEGEQSWCVAVSSPTRRLSTLSESYREVSQLWAYRHILPHQHVFTAETVGRLSGSGSSGLDQLDPEKVDPGILQSVLANAEIGELSSFTEQYIQSVEEALTSSAFCQFLMLEVRFVAQAFLETLGVPREELLQLPCMAMVGRVVSSGELRQYLQEVLGRTMELRDTISTRQGKTLLKKAVSYIDQHYSEETLSLNQVAQEVNVSASYLSSIFSQELGKTFTEYVTGRRMQLARELLRTTELRSGEIAFAVGYRDPHYFSFLFKKVEGCTPKEYRAWRKES